MDEYLHGEPVETRQKGRTPNQGSHPNTERLCRRTGNDGAGGQNLLSGIYRLPSDGISSARKTRLEIHGTELLPGAERSIERCCPCRRDQTESLYENWQFGQDTPSRKQKGVYDYRGASGIDRHPDEERGGKTGLSVLLLLRTADKRYNRLEMGQRLCG